MKTLIYARSVEPWHPVGEFRNERFFGVPEDGVETVYVGADGDHIGAAYAALGVDVRPLKLVTAVSSVVDDNPENDVVALPADWEELRFSAPDENGNSLRTIAKGLIGRNPKRKPEAITIIKDAIAED